MMSMIDDEPLTYFLSTDSITLTSAQIDRALLLSQNITAPNDQWSCYIQTLALLGIQTWLQNRSPELLLQSEWLSASDPSTILSLHTIAQLQVGETRLHLLPIGYVNDPLVSVPLITQQDRLPDIYVLVEVLEEIAEVRVRAYLPYAEAVPVQASETEQLLAVQQFVEQPDELLLHLHCAEARQTPEAALPVIETNQDTPPVIPNLINVRRWWQKQVDRLTEELSWVLLPPLNLSGALLPLNLGRSPLEDLEDVVQTLQRDRGVEFPAATSAAYRDLQLECVAFRLYALTWPLLETNEWSLLLILGAQPGTQLPAGMTLRVEDETQVLIEAHLNHEPYLYAQVIGDRHEQFRVSIELPNGAALTLPPFAIVNES